MSGTCFHTWYFRTSLTVHETWTPDAGNFACDKIVQLQCFPVGEPVPFAHTVNTNQTITDHAFFNKGHPIVTVGVKGHGSVSSSPKGITCPSTCSHYFAAGTKLTLTAAAKPGYVFRSWTGACSGSGQTCHLSLGPSDVATTAVFGSPATPPPPTPVPAASHPAPSSPPSAAPSAPVASVPAASDIPAASGGPQASSGGVAGHASPTPDAGTTNDPNGAAAVGPDPTLLVALGLVGVLLVLLIAFLAGRRAARQARKG
jgi:hypothetical protein